MLYSCAQFKGALDDIRGYKEVKIQKKLVHKNLIQFGVESCNNKDVNVYWTKLPDDKTPFTFITCNISNANLNEYVITSYRSKWKSTTPTANQLKNEFIIERGFYRHYKGPASLNKTIQLWKVINGNIETHNVPQNLQRHGEVLTMMGIRAWRTINYEDGIEQIETLFINKKGLALIEKEKSKAKRKKKK
jgi:hypothetical protein